MDPPLVTLVSGIDPRQRTTIARTLAGAPVEAPGSDLADGSDDVGEFALRLADDLVDLAEQPGARDVVVELPSEADTIEVALILETVFAQREQASPSVHLREIVSVTSVGEIRRWLWGVGTPAASALPTAPGDADDFETAERLAVLLEFATRVVLVDADRADPAEQAEAISLVRRLNPMASAVPAQWAEGRRGPFRAVPGGVAGSLGRSMGWQLELAGRVPRGLRRDGVDAVVYREPLPFHPGRLSAAVHELLVPAEVGRILRSRGLVQLASRTGTVGAWLTAGDTLTIEPTSLASWDLESPLGQEIAFFGVGLRAERLREVLDGCLLTADELLAGPALWAELDDPFPAWEARRHHH